MLKSEQAIQAVKELLPYLETVDARSEAIFQLLQQKRLVTEQDLEGAMIGVRTSKKAKWDALRAKLESVLKEQDDI